MRTRAEKRLAFMLALIVFAAAFPCALAESTWTAGFASAQIPYPADEHMYIAGYHNGWEGDGSLQDLCRATCAYLEAGDSAVFIISLDAIAVSMDTTLKIRERVRAMLPQCGASVHVCATHCHAAPDTLGLWGPVGLDGKNSAYMENLISACAQAACEAYANRTSGRLYYGRIRTEGLQLDSRQPEVFDPYLHQLRFLPDSGRGGRLIIYAAHAESMRGSNRFFSRDFPGVLADTVQQQTGDTVLFLSGAAGGLIMTRELTDASREPVRNRDLTGQALASLALSVTEETELEPVFSFLTLDVTVPMDNPVFMLYKYLGVLGTGISRADSMTGYAAATQLSLMRMGNMGIAFLPGEPFPELISGEFLTADDPPALAEIARRYGMETLLTVTLCDDELGYIIPPGQFLTDDRLPFIVRRKDETGEDHYEETNAVSVYAAQCLAEAFETLAGLMPQ